jgi:hypothetical protein
MRQPSLSVLTLPISSGARRVYQGLRGSLRPIVKPGVPRPASAAFPGHHALTRSVVEGLRAIEADFNFNPRRLGELARIVYAPANEALRQAAHLKRAGRVDLLVAGPVNAFSPFECDRILFTPEIDRWIVPSEWVRDLYQRQAPEVFPKLRVCPCGIDSDYWAPSSTAATKRVIVYSKNCSEALADEVDEIVSGSGFEPIRLRYGSYERSTFRDALNGSVGAVFLSSFETQGLALAEAWSMDVPTFVWDPRAQTDWNGWTFQAGSSAPYLTPRTGRAWQTLGELNAVLDSFARKKERFAPRAWVLESMTDAICAQRLVDTIRNGALAAAGAQ